MKNERPTIRRRTLVIGLGGTGSNSVAYLLRDLKEAGVLDSNNEILDSEPIRILAFDTDDSDRLGENTSGFKGLLRGYFVQLNQLRIERKIKEIEASPNSRYRSWYADISRHYIKSRDARHGVGQWRQLGRLGYVENQVLIETQIEMAFNELKSYTCEHLDSSDIDVYIVSSLAGGTGSGILIDIAYFLQRNFVEQDSSVRVNTHAYLLLPETFSILETGGRTEANSYAAIKEINAFYLQTEDFVMDYPARGLLKIPKGKAIPFTTVFLFDKELSACKNLQFPEEVFEYISSVMYIRLVSSLARRALSVFQNTQTNAGDSSDSGKSLIDNGYIFSACSGSIVEFPLDEQVFDYAKYRIQTGIHDDLLKEPRCVGMQIRNAIADYLDSDAMREEIRYSLKLVENLSVRANALQTEIEIVKKSADRKKIEQALEKIRTDVQKPEFLKILKRTLYFREQKNFKGKYSTYIKDVRPRELAEEGFKKISTEVENCTKQVNPCLSAQLKKRIIADLLKYENEYKPTGDETSQTISQEKTHYDEIGNFYDQVDAIISFIEILVNHEPKSGILRGFSADVLQRFADINIAELLNLNGTHIKVIEQKFLVEHSAKVRSILVRDQLPKWRQSLERDVWFEDLACPTTTALGDLLNSRIKELASRLPINTTRRFKNKIRVSPEIMMRDEHDRFLKRKKDEFWPSFYEVLQDMQKQKAHLDRDSLDQEATAIRDKLKAEMVSKLDRILSSVENEEMFQGLLAREDFSEMLKKAIQASSVDIFTNIETSDKPQSRVFWSVPTEEFRQKLYGTQYSEYEKNTARHIKEIFRGVPDEKIEFGKNQFIVYFETHHHPAYNIKGIRLFKERYDLLGIPTSYLHIHKDYAKFKDPIIHFIPPPPMFCGNHGCSFDISGIPRDVMFCPGCDCAILNRCGNPDCVENNLLSRVGGLQFYMDHNICPECRNPIRSYKWQCETQGHGPQMKFLHDKYCPVCNDAAQRGRIAYVDRSRRGEDKQYRLYCIGCEEEHRKNKQELPIPEMAYGVPLDKQEYLKAKLRESNLSSNNCPTCGSKMYPECPHSHHDHGHFLEMDSEGKMVCRHSESLHREEKDIFQCHHCSYPVKHQPNMDVQSCPRCKRELVKCKHCSDRKRYLIDKKSLKRNQDKCPVCNYKIE